MFHDRPTCARSRSRCSRPERGRPKVPFSWCRCHILVIDYRWGSIGSDETATATTGGPRVIGVFVTVAAGSIAVSLSPMTSNCDPEVSRRPRQVGTRRVQTPTHIPPPLPSVYTHQARCLAVRGPQAQVLSVLDPEPTGELQAPAHAGQATTDHQTYPERPPVTNIPTKKVVYLGPIAPRSRKKRQLPEAPSSRRSGLVGPHTTPAIVNYKYMTSTL